MVGVGRSAANRRGLGLAWLACVLPLIAVGGLRLRLAPEAAESLLVELPALSFDQPLEGHAAGLDRRGAHVAWLTRDGVVHQVRAEGGTLRVERHATPCRPSEVMQGPMLMFADVGGDGLVDAVVSERDVARHAFGNDYVLPQREDGRLGSGFASLSTARANVPELGECFGAAGHFTLAGLTTPGSPRSRTRVAKAADGRPVAMLDGLPCHVGDFDGDGSDDVLTAERADRSTQVSLRLHLGREDGFVLAGQVTVAQGDVLGGPGEWTDCADIDGDGRLEILSCEQSPARVRIWRLADGLVAPPG